MRSNINEKVLLFFLSAGYYVRIEQRLFYTRHLEKVLEMECHSEALKQFAKKSENHEVIEKVS